MLRVTVDSDSPVPVFEQLRRQVAALVLSGELTSGDRLPPIRQLAADLGIAAGTVARAYAELESAGVVSTGRGRGTRIAPGPGASEEVRSAADQYIATARSAGLDLTSMLALIEVRA